MRTKRTIAVVSTSAMAAGMAQGAVHHTVQNVALPCPSVPSITAPFDVTGDTVYDAFLGFDGASSANSQKPYIGGYPDGTPPNTAVLARHNLDSQARVSYGVPVTPFGTMIDGSFLTPAHTVDGFGGNHSMGYLYQDGNGNYVGDWGLGALSEGYVGIELYDAANSITNFAWLHLIFDPLASPRTLTLVDSGYEDTPGVGIVAGATNTVGAPTIYAAPASQTVP